MNKPPELFNEIEAAHRIGMSVAFLRSSRSKGVIGRSTPPPAHLKLGAAVRYTQADLDEWLAARRVDPLKRKAVRG